MPASSAEGLSSITAALDSTFKHKKKSSSFNNNFINNKVDSDDDDDLAESWVEGILNNELIIKDQDYKSQSGSHYKEKCRESNTMLPIGPALPPPSHKLHINGNMPSPSDINKQKPVKRDDQMDEPKTILYPKEKIKLGWQNPPSRRSGMVNLGNTCYLNSSLQALFHIPSFVNWLREEATNHLSQCSQQTMNISYCSLCAMIRTQKSCTEQNGGAIRPHLIVNRLKSIGKMLVCGRQEDAHEFLKLLLDHMEKSYLQFRKATKLDFRSRQTTPLNQIFGGYLRQQVSCPSCHYVSTTFFHFQDLVLDIRGSTSLDQALDHYFRKETLDAANCYKCEKCKKKVTATKKYLVERPPNVLLIQLKRFTFNGCKIGKHINIQQYLDLSRFVIGYNNSKKAIETGTQYKYKLTSMVMHLGGSQHGGHYIACGEGGNGMMFEFDDCSVRNVGLNNALLRNPYILFYELVKKNNSNSPNINSLKQLVNQRNGHDFVKFNGKSNANNKPDIIKLNRTGSCLVNMNKENKNGLSNGSGSSSSSDLGHVVERKNEANLLPPQKQRERISFEMKPTTSPSKNGSSTSNGDVKRITPKIVMLRPGFSTNTLLNNSNPSIGISSNGTNNSNGSIFPPKSNNQVVNKPLSTSQTIAELRKKTSQNGSHKSNGQTNGAPKVNGHKSNGLSSLVPYDSDENSDCDSEQKVSASTNGMRSNSDCSIKSYKKKTGSQSTDWRVSDSRDIDTSSTTSSNGSVKSNAISFTVIDKKSVIDAKTNGHNNTANGWKVKEKSSSIVSLICGKIKGTNSPNGEYKKFHNKSLQDNSDSEEERTNGDSDKLVNGNRTHNHGTSDVTSENNGNVRLAPAVNKLAWDRHRSGDLKYKLSGHKQERARENGGEESKYIRPDNKPIWTAEKSNNEAGEDNEDVATTLKRSRSFAFGTAVSTWDDEESQMDIETRKGVRESFKKTDEERYNEQLDHGKKRKSLSEHSDYRNKKHRFDDFVNNRSESANPNYMPLGNSSKFNNNNSFSNGYNKYSDHKSHGRSASGGGHKRHGFRNRNNSGGNRWGGNRGSKKSFKYSSRN